MTMAFSLISKQVASTSCDGSVRLWNAQTCTVNFVLTGHTNGVIGIAYSPHETSIASRGWDGSGISIYKLGDHFLIWGSAIREFALWWTVVLQRKQNQKKKTEC
jgi:WD40 repeat protein